MRRPESPQSQVAIRYVIPGAPYQQLPKVAMQGLIPNCPNTPFTALLRSLIAGIRQVTCVRRTPGANPDILRVNIHHDTCLSIARIRHPIYLRNPTKRVGQRRIQHLKTVIQSAHDSQLETREISRTRDDGIHPPVPDPIERFARYHVDLARDRIRTVRHRSRP